MLRILVLLAFAFPAMAGNIDTQMVDPYVEIRTDTGTGSGVVIDWQGEQVVLTAKHVADDATRFMLVKRHDDDEMETKWKADCIYLDPNADLAILRPRTPLGFKSAKLCFGIKLERGEDAWYVGSHSGLHASLEKSIINRPSFEAESAYGGFRKYTLVNGNGWYGNSGGPLFVKRGDDFFVVGIVVQLAALNPRTPIMAERLEAIVECVEKACKCEKCKDKCDCDKCECPSFTGWFRFFTASRDFEAEAREKLDALVKVKFDGNDRKAFLYYAGSDELLNRRELIDFLTDAKIGNALTRGAWADGILDRLDLDKSGQLTWDELRAFKKWGARR